MNDPLLELLRYHDLRLTTPRRVVFATLKTSPALTTRELRTQTDGLLDTASLYRTLNLFRALGVTQDVVVGGRRKLELTDAFSPHHHHLTCSGCGRIMALHDAALETRITDLAARHGFVHQSHSFEITGRCPACVNRAKPKAS